MNSKQAEAICGSLGFPSKMPGTAYGISALHCKVGAKLRLIAGTTCSDCYALKGRYGMPDSSISKAHATREASLTHPQWCEAIAYAINKAHGVIDGRIDRRIKQPGFHRWHDSGDLQSLQHLIRIVIVCQLTPTIRHWLPTREAKLISDFVKGGGVFPDNLTVRVSATMIDGAPSKAFPNTSTVHKHAAPIGDDCEAYTRGGICGPCRKCWDRSVQNVSYPNH
jgi:hypothetical protein